MARSKIKSTKADVDLAVKTGMKIEEAAKRRVLTENLVKLMPKGEFHSYSLGLLIALHEQHLGYLPEGIKDEVEEVEIKEIFVE